MNGDASHIFDLKKPMFHGNLEKNNRFNSNNNIKPFGFQTNRVAKREKSPISSGSPEKTAPSINKKTLWNPWEKDTHNQDATISNMNLLKDNKKFQLGTLKERDSKNFKQLPFILQSNEYEENLASRNIKSHQSKAKIHKNISTLSFLSENSKTYFPRTGEIYATFAVKHLRNQKQRNNNTRTKESNLPFEEPMEIYSGKSFPSPLKHLSPQRYTSPQKHTFDDLWRRDSITTKNSKTIFTNSLPIHQSIILHGLGKNLTIEGNNDFVDISMLNTHKKLRRYIAKTLHKKTRRTGRSEFSELQSCCRIFDINRDGLIDTNDLVHGFKLLGAMVKYSEVSKILDLFDKNHDGYIDYGEFIHMILNEDHPIIHQFNIDENLRREFVYKTISSQGNDGELLMPDEDDELNSIDLHSKSTNEINPKKYNLQDEDQLGENESKFGPFSSREEDSVIISEHLESRRRNYIDQKKKKESKVQKIKKSISPQTNRNNYLKSSVQSKIKVNPTSRISTYLKNKSKSLMKLLSASIPDEMPDNNALNEIKKIYSQACKLYTKKKYNKSRKLFLECITHSEEHDNMEFFRTQCLHNIGLIYYMEDEFRSAVSYYDESLKEAKKLEEIELQSLSLSNLGVVFYSMNEYDRSREKFEESIKLLESLYYSDDQHDSENSKLALFSIIPILTKNYSNIPFEHFLEVYSTCVLYLGWLQEICGLYELAIDTYNAALELFNIINDKEGKIESYTRLGYSYIRIANFSDAEIQFRFAIPLCTEMKNKTTLITCHIGRGICERGQGENSKSLRSMQRALALIKKKKKYDDLPYCYYETGVTHKFMNSYNESLECFEKCLESLEEHDIEDEYLEALCHYNLGQVYHYKYEVYIENNDISNDNVTSNSLYVDPQDYELKNSFSVRSNESNQQSLQKNTKNNNILIKNLSRTNSVLSIESISSQKDFIETSIDESKSNIENKDSQDIFNSSSKIELNENNEVQETIDEKDNLQISIPLFIPKDNDNNYENQTSDESLLNTSLPMINSERHTLHSLARMANNISDSPQSQLLDLAKKYYQLSLHSLKSDRLIANVWHNIGSLEFNAFRHNAALKAFQSAIIMYKKIGDLAAELEVHKKVELVKKSITKLKEI